MGAAAPQGGASHQVGGRAGGGRGVRAQSACVVMLHELREAGKLPEKWERQHPQEARRIRGDALMREAGKLPEKWERQHPKVARLIRWVRMHCTLKYGAGAADVSAFAGVGIGRGAFFLSAALAFPYGCAPGLTSSNPDDRPSTYSHYGMWEAKSSRTPFYHRSAACHLFSNCKFACAGG
jgi:hypothetical protein